MVVAEIPMWVVHSSVTPGGVPNGALANGEKTDDHKEERARESLSLLEGLGGTQKCAIYSIDVHPSGKKFATGGGDGTVRIWNAGALFQKTRGRPSKYGPSFESSGESSGGGRGRDLSHGKVAGRAGSWGGTGGRHRGWVCVALARYGGP